MSQRLAIQLLGGDEVAALLRDARQIVERHGDLLVIAPEPRDADAQAFLE